MAAVDADFSEFVRANEHALLRLAWLLVVDQQAAEDLVQTALEKTLPRWQSIRDGDPLSYVHRVMVNTRTSWWRRHKGRETVAAEVAEAIDPADRAERIVDRDLLATAMRELSDGQRKVVVLRHYADMSEAQVADVLKCSVGTVKSQNARALARLRAALRTQTADTD